MPGNSREDAYIQVRCDPEFKQLVRMAAGAEDKSVSQYVRDTLRDDIDQKGIVVPTTE